MNSTPLALLFTNESFKYLRWEIFKYLTFVDMCHLSLICKIFYVHVKQSPYPINYASNFSLQLLKKIDAQCNSISDYLEIYNELIKIYNQLFNENKHILCIDHHCYYVRTSACKLLQSFLIRSHSPLSFKFNLFYDNIKHISILSFLFNDKICSALVKLYQDVQINEYSKFLNHTFVSNLDIFNLDEFYIQIILSMANPFNKNSGLCIHLTGHVFTIIEDTKWYIFAPHELDQFKEKLMQLDPIYDLENLYNYCLLIFLFAYEITK